MDLADHLLRLGHRFVTGVPDSTLKSLCFAFDERDEFDHVAAASEGSAISLALGHYVASRSRPLVYMQNSGLPNALNPLLSMASSVAYDTVMTLVVGWRGRPGYADEPQHRLVGRHTLQMLQMADMHPLVIEKDTDGNELETTLRTALSAHRRVALVVSPDVELAPCKASVTNHEGLAKSCVLSAVRDAAEGTAIVVGGIGHTSRELLKLRTDHGEAVSLDFHAVGAMGYASNIAAGIALAAGDRFVICLDGDGSFLMHGMAISAFAPGRRARLAHIVLDNGRHGSVGGHPTCARSMDFCAVGRALGYRHVSSAATIEDLRSALEDARAIAAPSLVAVKIQTDFEGERPRPPSALTQLLEDFQAHHFQR